VAVGARQGLSPLNDIPGDWGTAVNVQAMVFGNMGDTSATGVAFTRDPATGDNAYYGEFLINAQGEDVVAGIRTPQYLTKAARERPGPSRCRWKRRCRRSMPSSPSVFDLLETHYRDMQDIEFTVQQGKLWMLQTRSGKRTAKAALKIAVDMAEEGLITARKRSRASIRRRSTSCSTRRSIPKAPRDVLTKGLPASPGAASGKGVRQPTPPRSARPRARASSWSASRPARGHPRHARRQGHPDRARRHDQPRGGGRARHGPSLRFGRGHARDRRQGRLMRVGGREVREGDIITIDGSTGEVMGRGADRAARAGRRFRHADGLGRRRRRLKVRANAETPLDCRSRAISARRASACAAPSICSSTPRASPRCAR
jgi:pyruvate,orthophosphate dikinase